MSNERRVMLRKFLVCSHHWCRELKEQYKDVDYKTQLSFCMKELLQQKKNGQHNLF